MQKPGDLAGFMHLGQIVQRGTHDELVEADGLYKQLFEMQTTQRRRRARASFARREVVKSNA